MTNTLQMNIGLDVSGIRTYDGNAVLAALAIAFPQSKVTRSYIRTAESGEATFVVSILCPEVTRLNLSARLNYLCTLLQQEAIAARLFDGDWLEALEGPEVEAWGGAFDPDLWLAIVPDNRPVSSGYALANLRSGLTIKGWTCGMSGALQGYFERNSDGTGGGLWFGFTNQGDLELIDYDGVFALPHPILCALREAGVDCDSSFE